MSRKLQSNQEELRHSRTGFSICRRGSAAALLLAALIVFCPGVAHAGGGGTPIPNITEVSPASVTTGNGFTLTVYGSNFLEPSVVNWNGTPLTTTYVSRHELTAAVPISFTQTARSGWITVLNAGVPVSNLAFVNVTVSTAAIAFVQKDIPVPNLGSAVALADFNGDGILDIVTGPEIGTTISVLLGNGDGTFQPAITSVSPQGMDGISVGDFNGDGNLDVAIVSSITGSFSILLGDGTGHFTTSHTYTLPLDTTSYNTAVGDFNDDGKLDVAVALYGGSDVLVYPGVGDGTLSAPTSVAVTGSSQFGIVAADFNGDGQIDLAVSSNQSGTITILIGNGTGGFTPQTPITVGVESSLFALAVGDFNKDGDADLAVGSSTSNFYILLGNGNGTFATPVAHPTSLTTAVGLAVGDLNGDGDPDVAAVGNSSNAAGVVLGGGTGTFPAATLFGTGTLSLNLAMGDLDHSGRQGLVIVDIEAGVLHVLGQDVVLTPSPLIFASQTDGTTSAPQTLTLTNASPASLILDGITFSGGNSGDFQFSGGSSCNGATVTLGTTCTIQVLFTPSAAGAETSTLFIFDNAFGECTATVNGTGSAPAGPVATFAPTGLIFPTQAQGTTSVAQSLILTNTGTTSMTGIVVTVTGTNSADFLEEDSCNAPLAVESSCTIFAAFKPSIVGAESASLSVADNAARSPQTVLLSGTGAQFIPVITWATPAAITYGTALSGTQLNATASVEGTFAYTPAAGTVLRAGSQPLSVTFTPADPTTSTTATGNVSLTVNKAVPIVTWATPAAITYGTPISPAQLDATASVPGNFTYAQVLGTILGRGSQLLTVTFTPTDTPDYTSAIGSVTLTVNKALSVVTWATPAAINYGTALSSAQLDATANAGGGTFAYVPAAETVLGAGVQSLTVTFTPTASADFTTATGNVSLTVNKGTAVVTWATPAAITYGTALSATQLNATANVAGTFVYAPLAGTVLTAGSQPLTVTFTPTDTTDSIGTTGNVSLAVNKATPVVTWATPAAITYGTALSAAQLDAIASVPGSFAYSPLSGVVLSAGSQPLSVTFTPTDVIDYTIATGNVTLSISGTATTDVLLTSASTVNPGASVTFTDTVSSGSGVPVGNVSFLDGATSLATVTLSGGVATFATSALATGTHTVTAVYAGTGNFLGSTSASVSEIIGTPTFALAPVSGAAPVAVAPGQSAQFQLTIEGLYGFTGMTTFSAAGLPQGATATFAPPTLTLGAIPATETVTVTTVPQFPYVSQLVPPTHLGPARAPYLFAAAIFAFAGLVFAGFAPLKFKRGNWAMRFATLGLFAVAGVLMGCGRGGTGNFQNTGTPAGTYLVAVTATSGTVQHTTTVTLVVQ